jgi:hypothetical protein
MANSNHA